MRWSRLRERSLGARRSTAAQLSYAKMSPPSLHQTGNDLEKRSRFIKCLLSARQRNRLRFVAIGKCFQLVGTGQKRCRPSGDSWLRSRHSCELAPRTAMGLGSLPGAREGKSLRGMIRCHVDCTPSRSGEITGHKTGALRQRLPCHCQSARNVCQSSSPSR